MVEHASSSPAEVDEWYLGRGIAGPFACVLPGHAAPESGERALDLASGTGSVAWQAGPPVGTAGG